MLSDMFFFVSKFRVEIIPHSFFLEIDMNMSLFFVSLVVCFTRNFFYLVPTYMYSVTQTMLIFSAFFPT